jgi:cation diffusion facilitator CzcD-associated flavoprotein CzcO/pimeloyl-ACP methyl ester carboxylesterase
MDQAAPEHHEIVIAGSGFSGLGMALQLKADGREGFVILERAGDLGGTWRDNSYPGCACDIPSILYSLTDEQNPGWTRAFARQPEIWQYLRDLAQRRGVLPHLRYGHELLGADWDEAAQRWAIETTQGPFTADVFVSAVGALADPAIPELPGLESFAGRAFHSAQWDHDHDLTGRRVAVIGTGASAVQFLPYIQPEVDRLALFQRTPPWIIPRPEIKISETWRARLTRFPRLRHGLRRTVFGLLDARHIAFQHPRLMAALNEKAALRHLGRQVPDAELRAKLTPDYRMGCKRILGSSTWYPAVTADNVDLVTDGIREVVPEGVVDEAGVLHEVDTIIFGTGFLVTDQPIAHRVRGRDGVALTDVWNGSPEAYYGTSVAGFPNFFMLLGPNTGLGHNSVLLMIEAQLRYVRQALAFRGRQALAAIEPRAEAQAAFVAEVDTAMEGSVWTAGGCQSWYLDATGRNSTLWPDFTFRFRRVRAALRPARRAVRPQRPSPHAGRAGPGAAAGGGRMSAQSTVARGDERIVDVGRGVTLACQSFGDRSDPPLLLIAGLGQQMLAWPDELCTALAARGLHVVRFDNRDAGRSWRAASVPPPSPPRLLTGRFVAGQYTLSDMARDSAGLLAALELAPAHVVGMSMGAMIGQTLAAHYPQSVRSLVSIMSTTGASRIGRPALSTWRLMLGRPTTDRDVAIERTVAILRHIGSHGFPFDEAAVRAYAAASFDRGHEPAGTGRQLAAIFKSGDRTAELARIAAPTLVVHGDRDRMVHPSGGRATAEAIPGARRETVAGMGHDLPAGAWDRLVALIADHVARTPAIDTAARQETAA